MKLGDTPKTPGRITHPLIPSQEGKILHLFSDSLIEVEFPIPGQRPIIPVHFAGLPALPEESVPDM